MSNTPRLPLSNRAKRLRLVYQVLLYSNIAIAVGYILLWGTLAVQGQFWRSDFSSYYTGWRIVRDGAGARLYDIALQRAYQHEILTEGSFKGGIMPYVNPPHAAVPFVALTLLPRATAFWMWSLGQVGLLLWLMRLLGRIMATWHPHERWLVYSGVAAFPPLLYTFMLGTFSLFMTLCILSYYYHLKQQHPAHESWGGVWLAFGTVKPQLIVVPGIIPLVARRWRVMLVAIASVLVMIVVTLPFTGWRSWVGFFTILQTLSHAFDTLGNQPTEMYNLKGTLTLLLGSHAEQFINRVSMIGFVLALVATGLLWRTPWQPDTPLFDLKMALTLLLGIVFNLHLNPHDGLMLIVPALLFYAYLRQHNMPRTLYAIVILSCPLLFLLARFTIAGVLGIRLPVLMMFALLVWMGKAFVKDKQGVVQ